MNHHRTRREFLKVTTGMAAGMGLGLAAPLCGAKTNWAAKESTTMAAMRRTAKKRKRRLIYNNDSGDIAQPGADTVEGFLAKRSVPILGSQVDSVFYCTGATTMFTHLAEVGETYGEFCPDGSGGAIYRKNLSALKAQGHDVLALTVEFCHQYKLEVFFTHRINDIHDTFLDWELSRWKRDHPEYLLGTRAEAAKAGGVNSPKHWWSALDFEKPEVLDYLCRIEQDVCRRYDIDGVEIDYFRSPMFFRPNLEFQPATAAQVELMTGFQRRIRDIAYEAGTKRGRPILVAARVPATPKTCRHVGIDVVRWIEQGLVDVLTVGGGYAPFTEPIDEIVQIAHRHEVPVYPTISASGMRGPEGRYSSVESWRGAASNLWRAGADGIVTFNIFPSGREPRFHQLGSPKTLSGLDKLFVIDPVRILEGDLVQGIEQSQILPITVPVDGKAVLAHLPIGDDLPAAAKRGALNSAQLRVQVSDPKAAGAIDVKLNGTTLRRSRACADEGWLVFDPKAEHYRPGRNTLSFRASRPSSSSSDRRLTDVTLVEVHVDYK